MAKAIRQIERHETTPMEEQAQALSSITKQLAENREAITTTLEIIQELHEAGVLDMVKGLLKTREKVGAIAIEQINQPGMHNIIKNGFNMIEFLGSLNPDQLKVFFNGISHGLEKSAEGMEKQEQVGLWGMMKAIRDPHVNASITTMLNFLHGMGEEMEKKQVH